jgi:hypothetical protein
MFIRFSGNIKERGGVIQLAGIPIKKIDFKKSDIPSREKIKVRTVPEEKKKSRLQFRFKFDYLYKIHKLIKKFQIKHLMLIINGGFSDPYETGKNYGYYWALKGAFPGLMSNIDYRPDFSSEELHFDGSGDIKIRMIHLILFAIKMLVEILKGGSGRESVPRRKGVIYV